MNTPTSPGADHRREHWKAALAAGPDCVPIERLAGPDLAAHERAHLEMCVRCQTERALAMEFEAEEAMADEGAAVQWIARETKRRVFPSSESPTGSGRTAGWWRMPMWATSVAAAAAIAIGVLLLVPAPKAPVPGQGQPGTVYRAVGVEIVAPVGDVGEVPTELRWQGVPGAARYEVRVLEVDGTEVWRTSTETPSATVPDVVRAAAKPARRLAWTVAALDGSGKAIAEPATASFRLVQ